jgi:hypothetical protein
MELKDVVLNVGGLHNVENSVAAVAVAMWLQIDPEKIRKAVASFRGVKRRFEYIVKNEEVVMIDDYAHHPEELRWLIMSVKNLYPDRECMVVFQPHLFTRTRDLADGFAEGQVGVVFFLQALVDRVNRTPDAQPARTWTAQVASLATTTLLTAPRTGVYRLSLHWRITQAASVSSSLIVTRTWVEGGVTVTRASAAIVANLVGTQANAVDVASADKDTVITVATTYASAGSPVMAYGLVAVVEALA